MCTQSYPYLVKLERLFPIDPHPSKAYQTRYKKKYSREDVTLKEKRTIVTTNKIITEAKETIGTNKIKK